MAKILVVEEEAGVRDLICRLLALESEYEITAAVGGLQGMFCLEKQDFDLVITAWNMSGMRGDLMLDAAKMAGYAPKRVIVVSGSFVLASEQLERDRQYFIQFLPTGGYLDLIAKPFNHDHFLSMVKRALAHNLPG